MSQYRGIFSIPQTPFTVKGAIDTESLKRVVDFAVNSGASGIVGPVLASEFYTLSDEEHREVLKTYVDVVDKRVPVVAGVTGNFISHSVALASYAEEVGCEAIIAMPTVSRPASQQYIHDYFEELSGSCSLPIFIQNAPGSGSSMSADFMIMLAKKFPLIQYVKQEGSFASHVISDLISKGSGAFRGIMGGMAAKFIIDEHSRGACGNMPGSYIVDIQVKVWDLLEAGELDEARSLQARLLPILLYGNLFGLEVSKYVLHSRGIIDNPFTRNPSTRKMDKFERRELDWALSQVSDLF
ncbi:MAG: dihydrodipicolinate synthase family protein [SAR202 cluster bacterium]|nr:dihydrodipicolinate synthase family protein [SAR202 cluster bacterium]